MKINGIYGAVIQGTNLDFTDHSNIQSIRTLDNEVAVVFDNGRVLLIYLDNKLIEYSLEMIHLSLLSPLLINEECKIELDCLKFVTDYKINYVKYLYLNSDGKEYESNNSYEPEFLYSRIGIKFHFTNRHSIYFYSAEINMLSKNEYSISRPDSVINLIIDNPKNGDVVFSNTAEFERSFQVNKDAEKDLEL